MFRKLVMLVLLSLTIHGCFLDAKIKLKAVEFKAPKIDNTSFSYKYFYPSRPVVDRTKFNLDISGYFTLSDFFAYLSKKTNRYSYIIPISNDKFYFNFKGLYSIGDLINKLQMAVSSNYKVSLDSKTIVISDNSLKKKVILYGEDVELSDKCVYDSGVTVCNDVSINDVEQLKRVYRFKTLNAYDVKYDLMIYRFTKEQYKKFLIGLGWSDGSSSIDLFRFVGNVGVALPHWFLNLDLISSDSESSVLFKSSFTARTAKVFTFKNVNTIQVIDTRNSDVAGASLSYKNVDVGQILYLNSFLVKDDVFRVSFRFENSVVTNYDLNKNPVIRKFELKNDLKVKSGVWYLVSSLRSNSVNFNTQINGFYNEQKQDYFVVFFKVS